MLRICYGRIYGERRRQCSFTFKQVKHYMRLPIVVALVATILLQMNESAAQQNDSAFQRLDSAKKREILKERIKEFKKEKIRHPRRDSVKKSQSQRKGTAGDQVLSAGGDEESEVSLAVHPADSNKLVLSYMSQGAMTGLEFPVHYSSDGGQSWGVSNFSPLTEILSEFPDKFPIGGGDPVFAWDKNGRVYMSWLYLISTMTFDTAYAYTMWAYSDDNGKNWVMEPGDKHVVAVGAMDPMSNQMFPVAEGMADRQWFAVDNSGGANQGNLYCSFFFIPGDENPNKMGTGVKVKKAGNSSFEPRVLAYNSSTQFANVEVDKDGKVHVTYADLLGDEIRHSSSTDAAQSFSGSHLIATAQNAMGGLNMVHDRENAATNLAVDRNGGLHVVWGDFASACRGFYSKSTDGGNSWSTPLNLNAGAAYKHVLMPTVAADKDVSISFYGIKSNDSAHYYQIGSTDGGSNFGSPMQISAKATYFPAHSGAFFGDYNRSIRSSCMDYSAWADGRSSNGPQVYFARTNHCTVGVKDLTAVNSGIQLTALYPNPANDVINLKISSAKNEKINVVLTDVTGKKIYSKNYMLNAGEKYITLPISNIAKGNTVLSIYNEAGLVLSRNILIQ